MGNNKSVVNGVFTFIKDNINATLTKDVKTFIQGFGNLETSQDPALMLVVLSGQIERASTSREYSIIQASIILKVTKSLDPQGDLLEAVDEIQEFIFYNPHMGGAVMVTPTKWELDTLNQGQAGILAFDIEIQA